MLSDRPQNAILEVRFKDGRDYSESVRYVPNNWKNWLKARVPFKADYEGAKFHFLVIHEGI